MAADSLSLQAQTAHAELLERLVADAGDGRPGSIVRKTIKGKTYVYAQHRGPTGSRQTYLGPDSEALRERVATIERAWAEARRHAAGREELVAMLRASGAASPTAAESAVLAALADAGLFRAGAVLVGTHAFACLGNTMGVRWSGLSLRTGDIDLAQDHAVSVALAAEMPPANVAHLVGDTTTGVSLWPIPGLDLRSPSTSFRVRGNDLRVDLLTPLRGRPRGPQVLPALGASAMPLRFLDFLLEETMPAAIVGGSGVLVSIPTPARFAVHKLIVARERPPHEHAKATKDLAQATALIDVLATQDRAALRHAWRNLVGRGPGWKKRAERSLRAIDRAIP